MIMRLIIIIIIIIRLLNILTFSPKLLRETPGFLYASINSSIKSSLFPSCLKTVDITPIYKKGKKDFKDSYRLVSFLPVLSKLYERSMLT